MARIEPDAVAVALQCALLDLAEANASAEALQVAVATSAAALELARIDRREDDR